MTVRIQIDGVDHIIEDGTTVIVEGAKTVDIVHLVRTQLVRSKQGLSDILEQVSSPAASAVLKAAKATYVTENLADYGQTTLPLLDSSPPDMHFSKCRAEYTSLLNSVWKTMVDGNWWKTVNLAKMASPQVADCKAKTSYLMRRLRLEGHVESRTLNPCANSERSARQFRRTDAAVQKK